MLLRILHQTGFQYSEPVSETVFEVRMGPSSDEDQTVLGFELRVTPSVPLVSYRDGFGNRVDLFNLAASYRDLKLEASALVRTHRRPAEARLADAVWNPEWSHEVEALENLGPSLLVDQSGRLDAFVAEMPKLEGRLADFFPRLKAALRDRFTYEKRATNERTRLSEALELGRGVCQDYAHLCIGVCRAMGVPARYASGYVNHPGEIATHAWCQVWCGPELGWINLDPTSGEYPGDDHVVVAVGRDYADVPPNRGVWKGVAVETMEVAVTVEPLDRLPSSWEGLESDAAWRRSPTAPAKRTAPAAERRDESRPWPAYPNQVLPEALLYRQQGQQQQQ